MEKKSLARYRPLWVAGSVGGDYWKFKKKDFWKNQLKAQLVLLDNWTGKIVIFRGHVNLLLRVQLPFLSPNFLMVETVEFSWFELTWENNNTLVTNTHPRKYSLFA